LIIKPRHESLELKIMRSLKVRMNLEAKEANYYLNLEKGFKGEQKFDEWIESLSPNGLVLHDLLLECNNTIFQMDSLFISSKTIYLFEVKNYEGDYVIEADRWYSLSRSEIKNPLLQLQRNESLLRRVLQELGFDFSVDSYVIFVNPEFQLYNATLNLPIIFPTQLHRFMGKLKKAPSELKDTHSKLAEKLLSLHLTDTPYFRLPTYQYDQLKKGITCPFCHELYTTFHKSNLVCNACGGKEMYHTAVLRSVEEFRLLFPNKKISTNHIYEWCSIIKAKKTIQKILSDHFKKEGYGKYSYYIPD
jgi:hypothetical protein